MFDLYANSLKKVELDQVLALLADCASSEDGKNTCYNIIPQSDLEDVCTMLSETSAAYEMSMQNGYPNFRELASLTPILERVDMGGCLQHSELLKVAGVLRCTRNVLGYLDSEDPDQALSQYSLMLSPNKFLEDAI